jgi:general secretion pathway protein L
MAAQAQPPETSRLLPGQVLRDFLTWWKQQMRGFVPEALWRDEADADALIVEGDPASSDDPPRVRLLRRRRLAETDLGSLVLDGSDATAAQRVLAARATPATVVLRLPAQAILERRVTLPLAAERALGRVLEYEMDRLTPFSAAELFWTFTIEHHDRARGSLHVRLSLVPKAQLRPLTEPLEHAGLTPSVLEAPVAGEAPRRIWLRRAQSAGDRWRRRGLVVAAGACAALAVTAAVLPFVLQASARATLEGRIAGLRPAVSKAEALRSQIGRNAAGADVITAEQARVGDALEVLATITDLLPDDTYLTDVSLRERKVELTGESAAAARLIAILSADPTIRNPAFAAPVTRLGTGTRDVFTIRAEIGG